MKLKIDRGQVIAKINDAWKKGLPILTNDVLRDCNEFCKLDKGTLRASAQTATDFANGIVRWNTPYARRQYWGIPTAYEPGTCWQWCEAAKASYYQRWADQAQKLLEMNL